MKKSRMYLIVGLAALFHAAVTHATLPLTELVKRVQPAVVKIVVYDMNQSVSGIGSGFFIDGTGDLITNFHVLFGAFSADVIAQDGNRYPIDRILAQDRFSDLVKVRVEIPELLIHPLNVTWDLPTIAEQVLVVGSPLGLAQSVSEGIVSAIREVPNMGRFFQTTAPISPGSSGSPVVNMSGDVVGVISFQSIYGQNLNFAIPGDKVLGLQDEAEGKTLAEWTYSVSDEKTELAEALCRKGFQFALNGEFKKALTFYKDATRKNPQDVSAWYGLSHCYVGLDRPKKAISTYKNAIRIHKKDAALHYHLGNYYHRLGNYPEAVTAYKNAVRLAPDSDAAFGRLGITYDKIGLYKKAIKAHSEAVRINPRLAKSHYRIGVAHGKMGNHGKAIGAYEKAVAIEPDFARAFNNMGLSYGKLGRHEDERDAFKQAIRINPDDPSAHYHMGLAFMALGEKHSALQEYKILMTLDKERASRLFERIYD